jgi:outer membrane protein TolC
MKAHFILLLSGCLLSTLSFGQTLTLKDAVNTGIRNYGIVKAKNSYYDAAQESVAQARRDYLPNLNLSGQQDYGTVNGQFGPSYGLNGLAAAAAGPTLPEQNWNAAFGALYLVNVNWDFFTFGRIRQRINVAKADAERYSKDFEQEQFRHKVRISAAYLNLLASQRLVISQQKNLSRATVFLNQSAARVRNGLLPGVDSTLASAEVSRARIALNQAKDQAKEYNNRLATLMGVAPQDFTLDSTFVRTVPKAFLTAAPKPDSLNPVLQFYRSRVSFSQAQLQLYRKEYWPTFTLFGVYQTRASGFGSNYALDQSDFSRDYGDGISPDRQNYVVGVGVTWNLTSIARGAKKVSAQRYVTKGLQEEYEQMENELRLQSNTADAKITFALDNYREAPQQVRAAQQAYLQKTTLYRNGLTNLVDVTQALYVVNRAETDRDIAYANVWQSLLLKAAATGDFDLFLNEF